MCVCVFNNRVQARDLCYLWKLRLWQRPFRSCLPSRRVFVCLSLCLSVSEASGLARGRGYVLVMCSLTFTCSSKHHMTQTDTPDLLFMKLRPSNLCNICYLSSLFWVLAFLSAARWCSGCQNRAAFVQPSGRVFVFLHQSWIKKTLITW